jgi:hypothetical protein
MLKLYGFSKVNAVARGHTRDLRVRWARSKRCNCRSSWPAWTNPPTT